MTVFRIPDIHCADCVRSLTGAIRDLDANATLRADLDTKLVSIDAAVGNEALAEAIRDAGFTVEPV